MEEVSAKILYHGSYTVVKEPDLNKCREGKDFGRGFYLTSSKKQAEKFVKSSVGKAIKNGEIERDVSSGFVSIFELEMKDEVSAYEFTNADSSWLKCIAGYRKQGLFKDATKLWDGFDIIAGKIANDDTNRTITNFINGDYGDVNTDTAVNFAISLLKPEKLCDQFCFRTERALGCLKFVDSYEVRFK